MRPPFALMFGPRLAVSDAAFAAAPAPAADARQVDVVLAAGFQHGHARRDGDRAPVGQDREAHYPTFAATCRFPAGSFAAATSCLATSTATAAWLA